MYECGEEGNRIQNAKELLTHQIQNNKGAKHPGIFLGIQELHLKIYIYMELLFIKVIFFGSKELFAYNNNIL